MGADSSSSRIELYWLPLGAGGHSVRLNGIVYEAIVSLMQQRERRDLFHAGLIVEVGGVRHSIEMTPVPVGDPAGRGVVASGPVGSRLLRRLRLFRYEIRCWPGGSIPDIEFAIESPVVVATEPALARGVIDALNSVPTPTWGRDELRGGEMWNSNSVIAWALERAGIDSDSIPLPANGRAPGWGAGQAIARRATGAI